MKPTVGRIVHYHAGPNDAPRAAIITHVWPGVAERVNLAVFSATAGLSCASGVPPRPRLRRAYHAWHRNDRRDFWSWPPRESDGGLPAKAIDGSGMNDLVDGLAAMGGPTGDCSCVYCRSEDAAAKRRFGPRPCPSCGSATVAGCDCE